MRKLLQTIKMSFNSLVIFISFKKNDIYRNNKFIIYLIIKTVCLGILWISQETTFVTSSTKFVSFLLWYEGIASGTKNSEMPIRRNMAKPQFMWSLVFNSMRWTSISQICCTYYCITPKHQIYIPEKHHWSCHIHWYFIHPFCYTLLVRITRN